MAQERPNPSRSGKKSGKKQTFDNITKSVIPLQSIAARETPPPNVATFETPNRAPKDTIQQKNANKSPKG